MIKRLLRKVLRLFFRYQKDHKGPTLYELKDKLNSALVTVEKWCLTIIPLIAVLFFSIFIYDAGFNNFYTNDILLYHLWRITLLTFEVLIVANFFLSFRTPRRLRSRIFNLLLIILTWYVQSSVQDLISMTSFHTNHFVLTKLFLYAGTFILFLTEASHVLRFIYRRGLNPSFLFVLSFFLLIVIGALLLLLPNATTGTIRPVDAWFTATSAVCVTGLTVVDTATAFNHIGQLIILCLIQVGGLGIMTFAGLLSYLSAGSVSLQNQLALKNIVSTGRISSVISFISNIIIVTFFFEAIGALLIYYTLDGTQFPNVLEKIFFSVFHSVSAFCNAGFSTYTNGLYELPLRYNYSLHMVIAILIILGGMGFPIVFNLFQYIRVITVAPVYRTLRIPFTEKRIHLLDATAKLALVTTGILLIFGFLAYLIFEQKGSLQQHPTMLGKFVTSLFGSVTPRTAGFNTVDLSALTLPTIMIYLLLMWIGASPGSTGGGIKTTVIAVACLNLKNIILGKARTEFARVQIGEDSIQRAFAIILLSLLVLGVTVLVLSINEPDKQLFSIAFEAFSAFGTVGLTLGITPDLSITSKIMLSFVMLTGRVGTLTLLYAIITPAKPIYYRYPREEISL
jgi:trk system potassium uptake protein